ncbi:hypothetical protein FBUS_01183 [Fasciolopsis buskii]|uniref:Calponin-homology (CH) domain-containing protein n=1 Tax=Fasciolopsis buskii TaxID=27845 RepID=A0A8E0RW92_9TREM|nr:hypothetical protein FBUS_01183 [Fasciolopsis buski]
MAYNAEDAAQTLKWIRGLPEPEGASPIILQAVKKLPRQLDRVDPDSYANYLSDGLLFGYLMSALDSGMLAKLQAMKTWGKPFLPYMEQVLQNKRIEVFLQYAKAVGVDPNMLFTPDDLRNHENLGKVVNCMILLSQLTNKKTNISNVLGQTLFN